MAEARPPPDDPVRHPASPEDENQSLRDDAIAKFTKLQEFPSFAKQDDTGCMGGLLSAALRLLNASGVNDEHINDIIAGIVIGGYVFKGFDYLHKLCAVGKFAPFKDKFDFVKIWLKRLEQMEKKITGRFEELEKHLTAVSKKGEDKFSSPDWKQYRIELKFIEDDLKEFVQILDRIRDTPGLNSFWVHFDKNDEKYIKECICSKKARWKLFRCSSYVVWGVFGLGALIVLQPSKIMIAAGVAVLGTLGLGVWNLEGYYSDIDIEPILKNLHETMRYFEGKKEDFKLNQMNKNATVMMESLGRFMTSMEHPMDPRFQPNIPEEVDNDDEEGFGL
ncbi:uncharacterized protein LOC135486035 [Lineus longissimus]|uniref:uncharacterized protein LOC135486035 n=1 Tax=Lineus longissimus TaxID=88925 RepID=UPI00315D91BE